MSGIVTKGTGQGQRQTDQVTTLNLTTEIKILDNHNLAPDYRFLKELSKIILGLTDMPVAALGNVLNSHKILLSGDDQNLNRLESIKSA